MVKYQSEVLVSLEGFQAIQLAVVEVFGFDHGFDHFAKKVIEEGSDSSYAARCGDAVLEVGSNGCPAVAYRHSSDGVVVSFSYDYEKEAAAYVIEVDDVGSLDFRHMWREFVTLLKKVREIEEADLLDLL